MIEIEFRERVCVVRTLLHRGYIRNDTKKFRVISLMLDFSASIVYSITTVSTSLLAIRRQVEIRMQEIRKSTSIAPHVVKLICKIVVV